MNRLAHDVDRVPDLGIWRRSDLKKMDSSRTIIGGPLIAIEVVSSESAEELDTKIRQYFAAGTQLVWVVYPRTRAIEIERPDGSTRLTVGEILRAPGVLPQELNISVADVFALLDED